MSIHFCRKKKYVSTDKMNGDIGYKLRVTKIHMYQIIEIQMVSFLTESSGMQGHVITKFQYIICNLLQFS